MDDLDLTLYFTYIIDANMLLCWQRLIAWEPSSATCTYSLDPTNINCSHVWRRSIFAQKKKKKAVPVFEDDYPDWKLMLKNI